MSVFDIEDKITPDVLIKKYNAKCLQAGLYQITITCFDRISMSKHWYTRATINMNLIYDEMFMRYPTREQNNCKWFRQKYKISDISSFNILVEICKKNLLEYTNQLFHNSIWSPKFDIRFGD